MQGSVFLVKSVAVIESRVLGFKGLLLLSTKARKYLFNSTFEPSVKLI